MSKLSVKHCVLNNDNSLHRRAYLYFLDQAYRVLNELSSVPVHAFKTGETIDLDEAQFEVLYTYADAEEPITNFNDNSAVLLLTCGGTRVLFPGDTAAVASKFLMKRPEKLRCDVVQVSHHGFFGLPAEVYRAVGAHTALWPTPRYEIENNKGREANTYLTDTTEAIYSADGTALLTLPYKKGSFSRLARVFPDKEETGMV